jgi:hypothetical protein
MLGLNLKINQKHRNPLSEISSARAFEVVTQTDMIEKTRSGVNAGQFIGFDPLDKNNCKKRNWVW